LTGVALIHRSPAWEVSAIGGFRYLSLSESFTLTDNIVGLDNTMFAGQYGSVTDVFATKNQFFGALIGLRGRTSWGPLSLEMSGRLSLGVSHEVLDVSGYYEDFNAPYNPSGPYGTFAMPSNEGRTSSNRFAYVPEGQIKVGYDVTPSVRVTVGYDVLYYSNVIRPTDQIDRNIPKGQSFQQDPGVNSTTSPARLFNTTDFYAHGLNVGLTARF
jgi:hypothetical protein